MEQGRGVRADAEKAMEDGEFEAHANRHGLGYDLKELGIEDGEECIGEGETGNQNADLAWRADYYESKLGIDIGDTKGLGTLARRYTEGIAWCYAYYYRVPAHCIQAARGCSVSDCQS